MATPTRQLVRFSEHAIERYIERVRPALARNAALLEMVRVSGHGDILPGPPEWLGSPEVPPDTVAFLVVGDVAMPLIRGDERAAYCAATVLVPRNIPDATRESRNSSRAKRTKGKRVHQSAQRRLGTRAAWRARLDGAD